MRTLSSVSLQKFNSSMKMGPMLVNKVTVRVEEESHSLFAE